MMRDVSIGVYHNVFGIIIDNIDNYEDETRRQSKRATYEQIKNWVKKNYNLHVSGSDIAHTKELCGLSKNVYKGQKASGKYAPPSYAPIKLRQYEKLLSFLDCYRRTINRMVLFFCVLTTTYRKED